MNESSPSLVKRVLQPLGCCFGCLGLIVGIPIALSALVYGVVFHTSLPLRMLLNGAETEPPMQFRGIRGSVSNGFKIDSWVIEGTNGVGDSKIEGLTFRYNGILDTVQNQRLIIDEISVDQATFVVGPDFFTTSDDEDENSDGSSDDEASGGEDDVGDDPGNDGSSEHEASDTSTPFNFVFELITLDLANVTIRSSDDQFEFSMPQLKIDDIQVKDDAFTMEALTLKDLQLRLPLEQSAKATQVNIPQIQLAGLTMGEDVFELEEFTLVSDFIDVVLEEAQPQKINGQTIPYSRRIRGRVLPRVNELIVREFDLTMDFATVGDRTLSRFVGFGGAVEHVMFPSGDSFLRTRTFNPSDYFALESDLIPTRCSILSQSKIVANPQTNAPNGKPSTQKTSLNSDGNFQSTLQGDCYWGPTQFTFPAQSGDTLKATAEVNNYAIALTVESTNQQWIPDLKFSSNPELPQRDILSQVYFQRSYSALSAGERSRINTLVSE